MAAWGSQFAGSWICRASDFFSQCNIPRLDRSRKLRYHILVMPLFPVKTCVICGEEFELKPDKPGFANRCPSCSEPEEEQPVATGQMDALERKNESEANAERRRVMRDMLYRKDS